MKSINYLIVELDKAYENEVEVSTGEKVIVNSTIEDVSFINRKARVVSAPEFTILQKGDEVIVHHNIFRLRNGVKGEVAESNYDIGDNKYIVPLTEVFMYKRDSDWIPIEPYCFVKPIKKVKEEGFSASIKEVSYKGMEKRVGIITYPNKNLINQGVKSGDKIFFSKNSEYEFVIEGELYYKMSTRDILAVE